MCEGQDYRKAAIFTTRPLKIWALHERVILCPHAFWTLCNTLGLHSAVPTLPGMFVLSETGSG